MLILVGATTVVLSVIASARGLSLLLVLGAIGSLMALTVRQHLRGGYEPHRSRRAMLMIGLAIVGFFVMVSVVGAHWPK